MNYWDSFRYIALKNVLNPDTDFYLRRLMRWYSKTFHTPLHIVEEEIPIEHVLLAYFEEKYESLEPDDIEDLKLELLETPEEKAEKLALADEEDATEFAFAEMTKNQVLDTEKKPKKIDPMQHLNNIANSFNKFSKTMDKVGKELSNMAKDSKEDFPDLPPDVDMSFPDDDEFEKLLNKGMGIDEDEPL